MIVARFFGFPTIEILWEQIHYMSYRGPNVGGYSYTLQDLLESDAEWFRWAYARLVKQREADRSKKK